MVTTAKAMAGGMPLAAVTGRADIMDEVHVGGLGGTYGGNPVACVAALAAIADHGGAGPRRGRHRIGAMAIASACRACRPTTRASATSAAAGP